jgi:hypothetical protein
MAVANLAVLIVSEPGDTHADVVEHYLRISQKPFARTALSSWHSQTVDWSLHRSLRLRDPDGSSGSVTPKTTVWWRRPGQFENPDLADDELQLARDETALMLPGILDALGVRWIDRPWTLARARNRFVQLVSATGLGIRVPETLVTNLPQSAREFMTGGPAVTKTISSGIGLAPFVEEVDLDELELVANVPTLLQRRVVSKADWRVVTVGGRCFAWRRPRTDTDPIDWRVVDPRGGEFLTREPPKSLVQDAIALQRTLDLNFSVQDWLEADDELILLEVNPQGQWLFLEGAESQVAPCLADHLSETRHAR